jgi:quinoprotein glucose dehydrogenase
MENCQMCHGADLKGGTAPTLADISSKMGMDAVRTIVQGGKDAMPPFSKLTATEMGDLMAFLSNPAAVGGGGRGGRGGRGAQQDDNVAVGGTVVAVGPAPASVEAAGAGRGGGGGGGRYGGNGGSTPYPEGVEVPDIRYNSAWAVSQDAIKPPWSTITAYDLNKGTIKWQVPTGDDLAMAARGIHDTGARMLRTGIIPTATGLVFNVGGDRKLRAYDEETGKVLWTKEIGGSSSGVPAMYEVNGRQYLVIALSAGGGRGGAVAPSNLPTGYVAFALPAVEKTGTNSKK